MPLLNPVIVLDKLDSPKHHFFDFSSHILITEEANYLPYDTSYKRWLLIAADQNARGLALKFSARSPIDSEHLFKSWYHVRRDYPCLGNRRAQHDYSRKNRDKLWADDDDDIAHGFGTRPDRRYWPEP